ncbi:4Fe-4S binding protein [candidate division WOR-3 bacterium]|nr:4Fe-4S binding protein [candidate division WOR-3 bacterium]
MAKRAFSVTIDKKLCKGCEICVYLCPVKILYIGDDRKVAVSDENKCIGCYLCEYHCPDFAIFVNPKEVVKNEAS